MDALIDLNVILDGVFPSRPAHAESTAALRKLDEQKVCKWVYAGSVQTLVYVTAELLENERGDLGIRARLALAGKILDAATQSFQWLAALSGEGEGIFSEEDPEDSQLVRSLARLGPNARLLTRDKKLLKMCSQAICPAAIVDQLSAISASGIDFIDLKAQQDRIRPQLEKRIHTVLHHGRYILGPEVQELEERLADYVGVKHCIGVSSGTDSLLIAMMALGIGPGDEVITVPYTWISTAETIALLGAKPVFVDIEPDTWNMDPVKLVPAITERTKAIMPVGIYGQTANMTAINEIAARHGDIPVIEDAAQCFGATHHGKRSCGLSLIGSTSFFPSKPLGGYGDGGALFTNDDALAQSMRQIRAHGQAKKHHHPILGVNGRLDTLQAAVVLSKLDRFDLEIQHRQQVAKKYGELLEGFPDVELPVVREGNTSVYAQYTLLSPKRDEVSAQLDRAGIPSVSYYAVPLHLQPVFSGLNHKPGDFPVTERVANQCLSLPMSPGITVEEQERICNRII